MKNLSRNFVIAIVSLILTTIPIAVLAQNLDQFSAAG